MLRSRLLVIPAAVAVAGASVFVASGTANAEVTTNDPTSEWVNTPGQFTPLQDINTPLASGWGISAEGGTDALTFGNSGVSSALAYATLVHPAAETTLTSDDLEDYAATIAAVGTGDVTFEITLKDSSDAFTLRTTVPLATDGPTTIPTDATWTDSEDDSSATLASYEDSFDPSTTSITGYGAQLIPASTVLAAIDAEEATTYFTPTPTGTVTPATPTVTQFTTTGVVLTGTGFLPGETLDFGYGTTSGGGELDGVTTVADADGDFTKTVAVPGPVTAGTQYFVYAVGTTSGVDIAYGVVPVADPAAPAAPVATPVRTTATFTG